MKLKPGSTDVTTHFHIRKAADGTAFTGADVTTMVCQYTRTRHAPVAHTHPGLLGATDHVHSDTAGIELDATNSPGLYRVDWPDAAFTASDTDVTEVILSCSIASGLTTPLRVELDWNAITLSDTLSDCTILKSDLILVDQDTSDLKTKVDSDAVINAKQFSDLLSDCVILKSDVILIDQDTSDIKAKVDSDAVLYTTSISDVKSELTVLDAAIDSDSLLYTAGDTKTQSDITDLSTKVDSDAVLEAADHDKTQSDIALIDAAIDSDSLLYLADHDKTQSDIADLSTKVDSDSLYLLGTALDAIYSDTSLLGTNLAKVYSDTTIIYSDTTVIEAAGGGLTAGQASDLLVIAGYFEAAPLMAASDLATAVQNINGIIVSDTAVIEAGGGSLTAAQASDLLQIASDIQLVYSDTTIIASDAVILTSDTLLLQSDVSDILSNVTAGVSLRATGLDAIPVTDPAAVADTFPKMLVQLWRRFFRKATMTATETITYCDDDTTAETTQANSDDETTQTQGTAT